jgi:transposase
MGKSLSPNLSRLNRDQLRTSYNSGLSMSEIAKYLNCSIHKVVYWMEKYSIKRRSLSEATYLKANPDGDPFSIKNRFNAKDMFLYGLGVGIYWGEGDKKSKNAVRVTNTDPGIIKTFRRFLLDICGLKKRKLLYNLIAFNDSNLEVVRNFWVKELKISPEKFGKIVQIPSQGKGTHKKKSKHGVCILIVCNMKLKDWMMKQIKIVAMPG